MPDLHIDNAECLHVHCENNWKPTKQKDGTWWYPSAEEAEFTAPLAYHMAVSLSLSLLPQLGVVARL